MLALGVVLVEIGTEPFTGTDHSWVRAALGDTPTPPVIDNLNSAGGVQHERIAELRPNLILAAYFGLEQKDYDLLSGSPRPLPGRPISSTTACPGRT